MIKKITKIKNLGLVFDDYNSRADLSDFKKLNIIYGWNGSGKTTFSHLFDLLNNDEKDGVEYELYDDKNTKHNHSQKFSEPIRVFNDDYVENNIEIVASKAKRLSIVLGKENKKIKKEIDDLNQKIYGDPNDPRNNGLIQGLALNNTELQALVKDRNSNFTTVAKEIGAAIGGNALRDYRKPQAETDFSKIKAKDSLSKKELEEALKNVKQDELDTIPTSDIPIIKSEGIDYELCKYSANLLERADRLLAETVESVLIERLKNNHDISDWVESGIAIHKKHKSKKCEYCLQIIPKDRVLDLSKHFNKADQKLKNEIDLVIEELRKLYGLVNELTVPDVSRFYKKLTQEAKDNLKGWENEKTKLLSSIETLGKEMKLKKTKTTEKVKRSVNVECSTFASINRSLNKTISSHNEISSKFTKIKEEESERLKKHFLSEIFDQVKTLDSGITSKKKEAIRLQKEIEEKQKKVAERTLEISSDHKACEMLNKRLSTFLGHDELKFAPHTEKVDGKKTITGYNILRGTKRAVKLSEGEKTAIALIHFLAHLEDPEFDFYKGVIVIDDPVSSLDSNNMYQAFSFLKNSVKDAGQIFILTHNFDFLKLLLNWVQRAEKKKTSYLMIKTEYDGPKRKAFVDKMDKELCEYRSEYHYLFKILKTMSADQDGTIAKAYPVPNIARKLWDSFLMYSVPNGKTPYQKMEELKASGKDAVKMDAIYKFTNDQSHITGDGFDPSLVAGIRKAIDTLFEMMQDIAPEHYRILEEATN